MSCLLISLLTLETSSRRKPRLRPSRNLMAELNRVGTGISVYVVELVTVARFSRKEVFLSSDIFSWEKKLKITRLIFLPEALRQKSLCIASIITYVHFNYNKTKNQYSLCKHLQFQYFPILIPRLDRIRYTVSDPGYFAGLGPIRFLGSRKRLRLWRISCRFGKFLHLTQRPAADMNCFCSWNKENSLTVKILRCSHQISTNPVFPFQQTGWITIWILTRLESRGRGGRDAGGLQHWWV